MSGLSPWKSKFTGPAESSFDQDTDLKAEVAWVKELYWVLGPEADDQIPEPEAGRQAGRQLLNHPTASGPIYLETESSQAPSPHPKPKKPPPTLLQWSNGTGDQWSTGKVSRKLNL